MKIPVLALITAISILSINSCKKNDETGFSEDIENFVPDSTMQALEEMGMIINEGKVPPSLDGYFLASPLIMTESSVPDESYDSTTNFVDYLYYFHNQDNDELTIDLDIDGLNDSHELISHSEGIGTFLSGNNSFFSSFTIQDGYTLLEGSDTAFYKLLTVLSGKIDNTGILDYQYALLMLDDYGDPYDYYIPNNTGRLFKDGDDLVERTTADLKSLLIKSNTSLNISGARAVIKK